MHRLIFFSIAFVHCKLFIDLCNCLFTGKP